MPRIRGAKPHSGRRPWKEKKLLVAHAGFLDRRRLLAALRVGPFGNVLVVNDRGSPAGDLPALHVVALRDVLVVSDAALLACGGFAKHHHAVGALQPAGVAIPLAHLVAIAALEDV